LGEAVDVPVVELVVDPAVVVVVVGEGGVRGTVD